MKKTFQILIWVTVLSGISVILGFALIDQKTHKCTDISVSLTDENPRGFITSSEIEKLVYLKFDSVRGKLIDSLNIELIEMELAQNPYIKSVNVYTTVHGKLSVEVEREEALIDQHLFVIYNFIGFKVVFVAIKFLCANNIDQLYCPYTGMFRFIFSIKHP